MSAGEIMFAASTVLCLCYPAEKLEARVKGLWLKEKEKVFCDY